MKKINNNNENIKKHENAIINRIINNIEEENSEIEIKKEAAKHAKAAGMRHSKSGGRAHSKMNSHAKFS